MEVIMGGTKNRLKVDLSKKTPNVIKIDIDESNEKVMIDPKNVITACIIEFFIFLENIPPVNVPIDKKSGINR